MIVFELICPKHHRFEGWFASTMDFDAQKRRGLLSCPMCADKSIERLPSARIRKPEPEQAPSQPQAQQQANLPVPAQSAGPRDFNELIDYILTHTDNVGAEFATEARRIHRKQAPHRGIRGTATREETEELVEEGIPVMPLPIPPQSDWH